MQSPHRAIITLGEHRRSAISTAINLQSTWSIPTNDSYQRSRVTNEFTHADLPALIDAVPDFGSPSHHQKKRVAIYMLFLTSLYDGNMMSLEPWLLPCNGMSPARWQLVGSGVICTRGQHNPFRGNYRRSKRELGHHDGGI